MYNTEQNAIKISEDKKRLLVRLRMAKSCLDSYWLKFFKNYTYDFENKCLVGNNGFILKWYLRENPEEKESYFNQQTNIGIVKLGRI